MKKIMVLLLFGALIGAMVWHFYRVESAPILGQRVDTLADRTLAAAAGAKEAAANQSGE